MVKTVPEPDYVLRGHQVAVNSIRFVDEDHLASGSLDGCLKLWNLTTRRVFTSISNAHSDSITAVRILGGSSDPTVITGSRDGFVKGWAMSGEVPAFAYGTGARHFCGCAVVPGNTNLILAPSAEESTCLLVDIRAKVPQVRLRAPSELGMITSLALDSSTSEGLPLVATLGTESGSILMVDLRHYGVSETPVEATVKPDPHLIDFRDSRPKRIFENAHNGQPVMATKVFGHVGEHGLFTLYSCGADRKVAQRVCAPGRETSVRCTEAVNPSAGTSSLALRADGKILAAGSWDGAVRVFETRGMRPLAVMRQHRDCVFDVDYAPPLMGDDFQVLASASKDCTIMIWSLYGKKKEEDVFAF